MVGVLNSFARWKHFPSICHKNISSVIKNQHTSLPHVESLVKFARANKSLDSDLYKEYITRYALIGDHEKVANSITSMEGEGFQIDTSVMNIHLLTFKKYSDSVVAKEVMEQYKKRGLEPDKETFSHKLRHFTRVHDFDSAFAICSEMISYPFISPTYHYNALIHVHGRKGELDECLKIGEKMEKEEIEWDIDTYGEIVKALVRNGERGRAKMILNQAENKGLIFDSSIHSTLLISLASVRDSTSCMNIVEEMADSGLHPNFLAYLELIDAFSAENNVDMAVKLLYKMNERDMNPPGKTFESLVRLCWNAHDSLSLSSVISIMKERGFLPAIIYLGLMNKYDDNDKNWIKSLALGEDLVERKEILTGPFYSKLISLNERRGEPDKCLQLLREAKQLGLHPTIFTSLFISFYLSGNLPVCLELVEAMEIKGNLNGEVCDKLVDMQIKERKVEDATNFLNKMDNLGVILEPATYNKLILAWSKTNRLDICTQLFQKMKSKGLIPTPVAYDILLAAYGKNKDITMCKQLWSDALKNLSGSDIEPIYNPMISTCAMVGDLKGALQLWEDTKERGVILLENTYITLINAHGNKGELKAVAGLFEEIVQKDIQHGDKLYNTLLRVFTQHGRLEKGPISFISLLKLHGKTKELDKILSDVNQFNTIQPT